MSDNDLEKLLKERFELEQAMRDCEKKIVVFIEQELHDELRRTLQRAGHQTDNGHLDGLFSDALQQFILTALDKWPENMLKARSRVDLIRIVNHALRNKFYDYYRRDKVLPRQATVYDGDDVIGQLAEAREARFQEHFPQEKIEAMMTVLRDWQNRDARAQEWADALSYYFLVGLDADDADEQLDRLRKRSLTEVGRMMGGRSREGARRVVQRALTELRKALES